MSVKINLSEIEKAKDSLPYIRVFINAYIGDTKDNDPAEKMSELNGYQNTLLAYHYFCEEITEGGFIQLIQNGYGPYIFHNPFAKVMKIFGAGELAKIIYKAKDIYDKHKEELEKAETTEDFDKIDKQLEKLENLEEAFFDIKSNEEKIIAEYIKTNTNNFAEIAE